MNHLTGSLLELFKRLIADGVLAMPLIGAVDPERAQQIVDSLLRGIPQDGLALGNPKAPVTLVEYADIQFTKPIFNESYGAP